MMLVSTLLLSACGSSAGSGASSGTAALHLLQPAQDQVLPVRSVGVQVELHNLDSYQLHYALDQTDQGFGDTTMTFTVVAPGKHRVEVEALNGRGQSLNPPLRVGADFTVQ